MYCFNFELIVYTIMPQIASYDNLFGGGLSNVYFCKIMFTHKDLTRTNMLNTLRYVTYFTLCNI